MSDINKLLWFLLILSLNGVISIIINRIKSKRTLEILLDIFSATVLLVCVFVGSVCVFVGLFLASGNN